MLTQQKQREARTDKLEGGVNRLHLFSENLLGSQFYKDFLVVVCNDFYNACETFCLTQNCDFVVLK